MKKLLILFFLFIGSATGFCQLKTQQWQATDILFKATSASAFTEKFGAVFTGPQKEQLTVPGFYNGDNEWVIRFSSTVAGNWVYTTYSTINKLSGKKGAISVTKNNNPNEHGSIIIDKENPQFFQYEDGTPYMLMAYELDWLFAMDYGKEELATAKKLLHTIKQHGFNQVVMNVYAYDIVWDKDKNVKPEYEYGSPSFFPFGGNNTTPDFSKLNTDYFKHFDKVIKLLQDEGIVAHLMIYVWNKKVNWPGMYTAADNMYFDYIINRYQAFPNIIWDISKEALYYGRADAPYISERIDRVKSQDAFKRLITVHDFSYCNKYPDKVDFTSIQYWGSDLYSRMRSIAEQFKNKPVFNIEHGGYEEGPYEVFTGNFISAEECLIRNYACAFAGAYSTYYWQNTSWNVIIPEPFAASVSPQPKLKYFKYFTDFFTKYPFHTLKNGGAGGNYQSLVDDKGNMLMYFPAANYAIGAYNSKIKVKDIVTAEWFDPFTGTYTPGLDEIKKAYPKIVPPAALAGKDKILVLSVKR